MSTKTTPIPHLFTVREAAQYLRTSERSMRELIAFGKITYRRTGGKKKGRIVFTKEDLDALLEPAGGPGAKNQTGRAQ